MAKRESKFKTIEELEQKRRSLVNELKEQNMFEGIKNTLTKLYTSSGHFIFELLQNAEDVFATSVNFKLESDKLIFEHNGTRQFDINDIDSITSIGDSTKEDNGNSIGKFGIGFKSVFEYTASPEIHSGEHHFQIDDLFVPKVIPALINADKEKTVIILPFNGTRDKQKCYDEINSSLYLESEVLLFLRNIAEINCTIGTETIILKRIDSYKEDDCPNNVCRILRKVKNGNVVMIEKDASREQLFYKRFFKSIKITDEDGKEKEITVAVAFKMECTKEDKRWKIKPILMNDAPCGRIFTYFPCKSEQKRFCFHIHAPFALTVDREKLREDEANSSVIKEIGSLICESMKELKSDGLVDLDLYKSLPNTKDDNDLGQFEVIRDKIIDFFLNNPYVLMADGSYDDGRNKYIGSHTIQQLLSDKDLSMLCDSAQTLYWVKNPMQNKRDYNFLVSLQIKEYGIADFLGQLMTIKEKSQDTYLNLIKLFEKRDTAWFVRLYSLMSSGWSTISKNHIQYPLLSSIFKNQIQLPLFALQLCYCNDEKLYAFSECYLSDSVSGFDSQSIHCVNSEVLNSKQTETDLVSFFRNRLGIKEYKLSDMIQTFCEEFEQKQNKTFKDTINFYKMYQKDNTIADVLGRHKILCSEDGTWDSPDWFYLPEEFGSSAKNLSIYYDFYNSKNPVHFVHRLNSNYKSLFKSDEDLSDFLDFLEKLGIETSLVVWKSSCRKNPNWLHIQANSEKFFGGNTKETDEDFEIKYLDGFFKRPLNEAVFELILSFLQSAPSKWKICKYSPAQKYQAKHYHSHIAVDLCNNAWVLQVSDGSQYFVKPEEAFLSRIPHKYKKQIENQNVNDWLHAINFGKKERQQSEQQQKENEILESIGLDIGFVDIIRELKLKGVSAAYLEDYMQALKEDLESRIEDGFFLGDAIDEKRIKDTASDNFNSANDITFEKRYRSIRISNGQKELAEQFLRSNCIDEDKVLHCQICKKTMPFKNRNNEDYFEVVQLFHKELIKKDVRENYVALCPVCSAKMKVFYQHDKTAKKNLYDRIRRSQSSIKSFKVNLDKEEEILFSERHIIALRKVIEESMNYKNDNPEALMTSIISPPDCDIQSNSSYNALLKVQNKENTHHTSIKMNKSEAVRLLRNAGLGIYGQITFSSKNSGFPTYWANPRFDYIYNDWWLVLNDTFRRILHVFFIPANSIEEQDIVVRADKPELLDIQINYDDSSFQDNRSKIYFQQWVVKSVKY